MSRSFSRRSSSSEKRRIRFLLFLLQFSMLCLSFHLNFPVDEEGQQGTQHDNGSQYAEVYILCAV